MDELLILNMAVVVFRGTEPDIPEDVVADINLFHAELMNYGEVHSGFLNALKEVQPTLLKALEANSRNKPLKIWVSGHSLGGALATLFSADILSRQEKGELSNVQLMGVYTVGSPRVGDSRFAENFDQRLEKQAISFVRIRNHKDVVTGIPVGRPGGKGGYWHVGSLAYFDAKGELFVGDGWEQIESQSDIKNAYPKSIPDHDVVRYTDLVKKAYLKYRDSEWVSCENKPDDRPLRPYKENPESRR